MKIDLDVVDVVGLGVSWGRRLRGDIAARRLWRWDGRQPDKVPPLLVWPRIVQACASLDAFDRGVLVKALRIGLREKGGAA
jgi:hypothetical protein